MKSILTRSLAIVLPVALLIVLACRPEPEITTKRIIIMTNGASPYWDACREGLLAANEELNLAEHGLTAVMEVNDGTPQGQIDKLRQYATQSDIVAVGVSVVDARNAAIADEMKKLRARGIHVVAIDNDVDRERFRDARYAFIGTDNYAAGVELGRATKVLQPDGGEYVTFVGRTGAQNAVERVEGFAEGVEGHLAAKDNMGDEFDRSRAKENVRNAMANHPKLNTLVGIYSYNGPAAADVATESGRAEDFVIVTFDAEPASQSAMESGLIDCMMVQNPFDIGYQGVKLMAALAQDDKEALAEMFPNYGQGDGDLYITNLKVVVPNMGSPLTADVFDDSTELYTLDEFREWLDRFGLKGS